MSDFEKLLGELAQVEQEQELLSKSMSADAGDDDGDNKIESAASEDDSDSDDSDTEEAPMKKSLSVDGEDVELVDASELIKSLSNLETRVGEHESLLAKALSSTLNTVKTQGEMIKSLTDKVEAMSNLGRGRKTVLSIVEKPNPSSAMAKSHQQAAPSGEELMAKCLAAHKDGKITAIDVGRAEISLQSGANVPADIINKLQ